MSSATRPDTASSSGQTKTKSRLLLVTNRLPISVRRSEDGKFSSSLASGGLISGLAGLSDSMTFYWYGWPGLEIPTDETTKLKRQLKDEYNAVPVFMRSELAERHINGFSNQIMWPLFHYHPSEITFDQGAWEAYKQANRLFAQAVAQDVKDGDMVWIHDYHLMLLPKYLKETLGDRADRVKIGFFLHIPFPSSEIYRILPVRTEILLGILECNLIGFQTYDYVRHFLSSCGRILGLKTTPTEVFCQDRTVQVGAFGIGIDPDKIANALQTTKVQDRIASLQKKFQGMKLILGVDRLDYIKGMPQKLHAFEIFLTEHPEWVGKIVLIQVAVPSRQDVEEYQSLRSVVNELVGRINGRYGSIDFMPIHFIHQSVPFDELVAMYAVSDACIVTSTRDGMNLVSYEYIATQRDRHGVLLLSEFTGAAQVLHGSLIFNPWNTDELASALHEAVTMSAENRRANWDKLIAHVRRYTSTHWASSFLRELSRTAPSLAPLAALASASASASASAPEPIVPTQTAISGTPDNADASAGSNHISMS